MSQASRPDTAAIRAGEELDVAALRLYLDDKLFGGQGELSVTQFPGGHSNLTYLLRAESAQGSGEAVLRRAPMGPVAPKAHDMVREYHLLAKINPVFAAAPRPLLLCEDPSVIGAPFFLMERRQGVIIRTSLPPAFAGNARAPAQASQALVDTLAQLHALDIDATGLRPLGKPEGFNQRQVEGWAARWQRAETHASPQAREVTHWLLGHVPPESAHTIVHNDFKLDNLMLAASDPSQVVALLDWEMTTLGDPLVDLGLSLAYWTQRGFPAHQRSPIGAPAAEQGFYTREQFLARYAEQSGRDLSNLAWYEVLGVFKLAVILQQIYARYHAGQTQDPRFALLGEQAQALIAEAARQVQER